MATVVKDVLTVSSGVIVHPVSCGDQMSGGFSFQVTKKFPKVLQEHIETTLKRSPLDVLGQSSVVHVTDELSVANVYCLMPNNNQNKFEYLAFKQALLKIVETFPDNKLYFPYKLGCSLQGCSWKEIEKCIKSISKKHVICIMPRKES
jgi:hypothetical protein